MTTEIVYKDQEFSVFGWTHPEIFFVSGHSAKQQGKPTAFSSAAATFSCTVSLEVGAGFSLKETGETFVVTSAKGNMHQARKTNGNIL